MWNAYALLVHQIQKRPTASLIESSPWRLLSGAQVSAKKQQVHMNASNDHMFAGVDPYRFCVIPLGGKKGNKSGWAKLWDRNHYNMCHSNNTQVASDWLGLRVNTPQFVFVTFLWLCVHSPSYLAPFVRWCPKPCFWPTKSCFNFLL